MLKGIHHIAIICSNYQKSKHFYTKILGLQVQKETYVDSIEVEVHRLKGLGVTTEPIRIDALTGKKFTFFADPDDFPLECYEASPLHFIDF